jgi:anti-anti-sigma regulatory factor/anti-sigma regulatory factor (Ser/Thr protein kinase)
VHECLADRPNAVVVDLSAVNADSDGGLDLLSALARAAVASAGPSIVLSVPSPRLSARLSATAITRHLSVHPNLADALAQAHRTAPVRRLSRRFAAGLATSEAARALVAQACLQWAMLGVADRATTIVTELVANAVLHADTDLTVSVADLPYYLHIAVRDGCHRAPRLGGRADANAPSGSGLLVVEALAAAWGYVPDRAGKTVWATVQNGR